MRNITTILGLCAFVLVLALVLWIWSRPERGTTGQVSTNFRWLGPNDRIAVDGFDDPKVQGVACDISRAVTGGVKGALGVAEDTSDASIACRQVGPIRMATDLNNGEPVFDERRSLLFKQLHVVRFYDRGRNVLRLRFLQRSRDSRQSEEFDQLRAHHGVGSALMLGACVQSRA
jgi:CreA protein